MPKTSMFLEGNDSFQESYFKNHEKELLDLAENGQHPKALFIGCADSRVVPNLITQTAPGDLFVCRNVGNFVAPYKPDNEFHATASAIEYAISALKVEEIIICGHTHCGAIQSLYADIDSPDMIHTKKWLTLGAKAKSFAMLVAGKDIKTDQDMENLYRLTERLSLVSQIENLLTYPSVKKAVAEDRVYIHGWVYDIENGEIDYYDAETRTFKSLSDLKNSNGQEND